MVRSGEGNGVLCPSDMEFSTETFQSVAFAECLLLVSVAVAALPRIVLVLLLSPSVSPTWCLYVCLCCLGRIALASHLYPSECIGLHDFAGALSSMVLPRIPNSDLGSVCSPSTSSFDHG